MASALPWKRGMVWILSGAALFRVVYLVQVYNQPPLWRFHPLDSELYLEMAARIAAGDWMAGSEAFSLSPLYFYFLALLELVFRDARAPLYLLQQAMGLASIYLTGRIARHLYGDLAGLAAATLAALYAPLALMEVKVMASALAVLLSLLGVDGLLRAHATQWRAGYLVPGLLLGLACLARPNTLLFVPVAVLWLAVRPVAAARSQAFASAGFLALGIGLAIAPVTLRNFTIERAWIPISSQAGITFYQANNPEADGTYSVVRGFSGNVRDQSREARELAERAVRRPLSRTEVDRYWLGRGLTYLVSNPGAAASLVGTKLLLWLGSSEISTEYAVSVERQLTWLLWLLPVPFGAILGLAALGLFGRPRTPEVVLVAAFVAVNLVTILAFYFSSRYRLPAVPFLCVLAGGGVAHIRERFTAAGSGAAALAAIPAVAIMLLSLPIGRSLDSIQSSAAFYNLGIANFMIAEYAESAECFERVLAKEEGRWEIHFRLGHAYRMLERYPDAAAQYARVLELDPDNIEALRLLVRVKGSID